MINTNEIIDNSSTEKTKVFKLGTIDTNYTSGMPTIIFDGEDNASRKKYQFLDSYIPTAGDRVILASMSGTYIILGKITATVSGGSESMTLDDLYVTDTFRFTGNQLGFFGKLPASKTSIDDLNSRYSSNYTADSTYSDAERRLLNYLRQDMQTVFEKVDNLIGVLRKYGLV